jgi:DNA-binding transcriptional LysR family regulator
MDRIDEWRLFATVARLGSFSRAAETHRRSPQAVTRAISALEKRIGTRLLHRTTRSVSLTDEGARHLELARRTLAEFEQLETPAHAAAELRGAISVTAPMLFGQLHVMPIVTRFLADTPAVDVRLLLLDRVVSLAEEGLDLGVRIGALPDSALKARLVGHVRSVICASPEYLERQGAPRSPESLARHQCVAFTATTPIAERWSFPSQGRRERSVTVHPRLVVNTGQAAIDAALAGTGLVRMLSYQVDEWVTRGKLRVVLRAFEPEPVPVHLVQLPGAPSRITSAFAEFAAAELIRRLGHSVRP